MRRVRSSCLTNVILLLVATLVCIAVIDGVAYFALGIRGSRHGASDFIQFSPLLGHFHIPNTEGRYYPRRGRVGHDVSINSHGFCDEERSISKDRPRVLLVGDSTTEAWEVDPHERPHVVLEDRLGGGYEVLNCGVRAFGTDQTLVLLEHIAMAYDPDVVVYTFCINDIRDNGKDYRKPWFEVDDEDTSRLVIRGYPIADTGTDSNRASDPIGRYSLVYRTFGLALRKFAGPGGGAPETFPLAEHFELTPYKTDYNEVEASRWRLTRRLVSRMRELSNVSGAEFLLVECLHRPEIDADTAAEMTAPYEGEARFDFRRVTRLFEGLSEDTGLAFVSMAELAIDAGHSADELMPPGDTIHMSERGIELWAEAVARELFERGWATR